MNFQALLPLISQVVGRDLTPEATLFYRARAAIGKALNPENQTIFIDSWPTIVDFMETEEGQIALSTFLNDWIDISKPSTKTEHVT